MSPTLIPLLHAGAGDSLWTAWVARPQVMAPLLLLTAIYTVALVRLHRGKGRPPAAWRVASYYVGMALLVVALLGPLDVFNDSIFFLHMLQHTVLMQISAPLIALGLPVQVVIRALPPRHNRLVVREVMGRPKMRRFTQIMFHPVPAFVLFNVVMGVWHIPVLYQAVLDNELLHDFQHITFFATAYLCWWLIVDPFPRHRKLPIPWAIGPLFLTAMASSAVGATLTLAETVVYDAYLTPDALWGLSGVIDQQIGGLIMWVGGGLLYTAIFLVMLFRSFGSGAEESSEPAQSQHSGVR